MLKGAQTMTVYSPPQVARDGTETRTPLGTVRAAVSIGSARESNGNDVDCTIVSATLVLADTGTDYPRGTTLAAPDGTIWTVRHSLRCSLSRQPVLILRCTSALL